MCILLCACLLVACSLLIWMMGIYAVALSMPISCYYPERFPSEVANDAAEWCQTFLDSSMPQYLWKSRKLNLATVLVHTWPATVKDLHRAVSVVESCESSLNLGSSTPYDLIGYFRPAFSYHPQLLELLTLRCIQLRFTWLYCVHSLNFSVYSACT